MGHGVSYGHHYTTSAETTLGLIPLGYADGIPRHASGRGPVLVGGALRRVAGRVAMDQFVVDLGGDVVEVGSDAVLFGPGDRGEPSAEDWAEAAGDDRVRDRHPHRRPGTARLCERDPGRRERRPGRPGRDPGRRERDPARSDLIKPDPARPASPDQT